MPNEPGRLHVDQQQLTAGLLLVLTIIALGGVLKITGTIVQPLVIALLLSFVLSPLVEFLHRGRIPWLASVLIVIALLLGFGILVAFVLYSSVQSVVRQLPRYIGRLLVLARQLLDALELPPDILYEFDLARQIGSYLVSFSGDFLSVLGSLAMILVFLLFLLLEKPYLRPKVMQALQGPRTETIWRIVGHTNAQIGRYLSVKLVVSLATGLLVWGAFTLIGVEFAFIWAAMTFLFNFIPSIGSILIGAASFVFALVQFYPDPNPIIAVGISMLTIQFVLGNVIDPKLQGDRLKISPVVILFSLLFWGWLWGIVGMFLAVPLTVALKIVFENIPGFDFLGVLMGRTETDQPQAAETEKD
ncbi:MAG: AI-2E family transporter [Spirochaetota bacterium]